MLNVADIEFKYTRGKGPGGQHKNKTSSCVVAKHLPSGIIVRVDGRDQHKNKAEAIKELEKRLVQKRDADKAKVRKARRDEKIKDHTIIRTYNIAGGIVTDHRTKKSAPVKQILAKGRLDLLR